MHMYMRIKYIYIFSTYHNIISVFQRNNPLIHPDFSEICTASQPLWPLGSYSHQQWPKA